MDWMSMDGAIVERPFAAAGVASGARWRERGRFLAEGLHCRNSSRSSSRSISSTQATHLLLLSTDQQLPNEA